MDLGGALLLGSSDVVRFGPLRLWADRGLIHIEDSRDNGYDTISVRAALERVNALNDVIKNSKAHLRTKGDDFDRAEITRHQNMIDGMVEIARKAQIQGMPDDPTARRDMSRRRVRSVVVTGTAESL